VVTNAWKSMLSMSLVLISLPPAGAVGQARPEITVGVRPLRVRGGDPFTVTVRVRAASAPSAIDIDLGEAAVLVDHQDRSSTGLGSGSVASTVVEREFFMEAVRSGTLSDGMVYVEWEGREYAEPVPVIEVSPPGLDWGNRPDADRGRAARETRGRRGEPPVRSQGVPPAAEGRDAVASPWSRYGSAGWGVAPSGNNWSESARGDPWWDELVPRLNRYATAAEDPMGMIRLESGIAPERVYVGQQLTVVATATFAPEARARLGRDPEFFPPEAVDAWVVDIPLAPGEAVALGGRVQEAHTFMRAFFPVRAGLLTVDPVRLVYAVGSRGGGAPFGDTLAAEPLVAQVLPIPRSDAVPGWAGAVGRYHVSARVFPASVGWGESALLTLEVAGAGYVSSVARPDIGPVWGAEVRPVGERSRLEVRDGVVGGVKTFSWMVVPVESGLLRLGPIVFSYFDPWLGAFAQVATEETTLEVVEEAAEAFPGGSGMEWRVPVNPYSDAAAGADPEPSHAPEHDLVPGESDVVESMTRAEAPGADADEWLMLGEVFTQVRAGEGWDRWAWMSGLREHPRDVRLRRALWGSDGWHGREHPGLPGLPFRRGEALAAAIFSVLAVAWGSWRLGLAVPGRPGGRVAVILAAVMSGAALVGWGLRLHSEGRYAVVVDGSVGVRPEPMWASESTVRLAAGTALAVVGEYGEWIQVSDGASATGWVERTRLALLEPAAPAAGLR